MYDNEKKDNADEMPASVRFTLRKPEKLRHRQLVSALFEEGKNIYDYPLRLTWRLLSPEELRESFRNGVPSNVGKLQMLVTVPKKKRRYAVDRVLLRRRIREAYRLNRNALSRQVEENPLIGALHLAFIYLDTENRDYAGIERSMRVLLERLSKKVSKFLDAREQEPDLP